MKLKTQETIRAVELASYLGVSILSTILTEESNIEQISEIVAFLENNQIDLIQLKTILNNVYFFDYCSSFRTQTITDEYKELKTLYDEIIKDTSNFYNELGINNPISIFATYVYMYRNGYFSHDKKFLYSNDMKDFAKLSGLDVVRGRGVCRSISSMLTDIYNDMGMTSYNLSVNTSREQLKHLSDIEGTTLEKDKSGEKIAKIVGKITEIIPIANHLITMVEQDGKNYILDPTNNGMLRYRSNRLLQVSEIDEIFMKNCSFGISNTIQNLLGQYSDGINVFKNSRQLKLPTITEKEYEQLYLKAFKFCLENKELLDYFYEEHKQIIDDIYSISKEQSGFIKRLIPIIPTKK